MARSFVRHLIGIRSPEGHLTLIRDALVQVVDHGTTDEVEIFADQVGGMALTQPLRSSPLGEVEFWTERATEVVDLVVTSDDLTTVASGLPASFVEFTDPVPLPSPVGPVGPQGPPGTVLPIDTADLIPVEGTPTVSQINGNPVMLFTHEVTETASRVIDFDATWTTYNVEVLYTVQTAGGSVRWIHSYRPITNGSTLAALTTVANTSDTAPAVNAVKGVVIATGVPITPGVSHTVAISRSGGPDSNTGEAALYRIRLVKAS